MSGKVTWWPAALASSVARPTIVLLRYDWPDQRIYAAGRLDPAARQPWTNGSGEPISPPDYFMELDQAVRFITIPPESEYTYAPPDRPILPKRGA